MLFELLYADDVLLFTDPDRVQNDLKIVVAGPLDIVGGRPESKSFTLTLLAASGMMDASDCVEKQEGTDKAVTVIKQVQDNCQEMTETSKKQETESKQLDGTVFRSQYANDDLKRVLMVFPESAAESRTGKCTDSYPESADGTHVRAR